MDERSKPGDGGEEDDVRDPPTRPRNNMEVVAVTGMSLNLLIVTVGS